MRTVPLIGLALSLFLISAQGTRAQDAGSPEVGSGTSTVEVTDFPDESIPAACGTQCSNPGRATYSYSFTGHIHVSGGCSLGDLVRQITDGRCGHPVRRISCEQGCTCHERYSAEELYPCPSIPAGSYTSGSCTISWEGTLAVTVEGTVTYGTLSTRGHDEFG